MVIQALADMLRVNIDVLTTLGVASNPVIHHTCQGQSVGTISVGLIGQIHYVALESLQHSSSHEDQCKETTMNPNTDQHDKSSQLQVLQMTNQSTNDLMSNQEDQSIQNNADFDQSNLEDEDVQHELIQFRGLPYESGLQEEELEAKDDKTYSVAPGEGQTPINLFTDEH